MRREAEGDCKHRRAGSLEPRPLDSLARLITLVPPPPTQQTRYHGVFAPHHALRAAITPAGRGARHLDAAAERPVPKHVSMGGVSIGVVPIDTASDTTGTLMSAADVVCYIAKDLGRNRIHVYEEGDAAERHQEMQWVARINRALEEERFELELRA